MRKQSHNCHHVMIQMLLNPNWYAGHQLCPTEPHPLETSEMSSDETQNPEGLTSKIIITATLTKYYVFMWTESLKRRG